MEINNDVDSMLLQMFSSMATQDREVLVTNFKGLLGDQLSADECAFFLDMNNWHVHSSIQPVHSFVHSVIHSDIRFLFVQSGKLAFSFVHAFIQFVRLF